MEDAMSQGRDGLLELDDRQFAVRSERVRGHEYVRVTGELDLSVIGLVDREMERAEATDATRIVLDLDDLEFMDASGVRLLLHLTARSESNGRRLRITRAEAPQVQRVLELTGVDERLPFED
jgi:stage II sporulation protein AA (anti-sigma F factor antagonist)